MRIATCDLLGIEKMHVSRCMKYDGAPEAVTLGPYWTRIALHSQVAYSPISCRPRDRANFETSSLTVIGMILEKI